MTVNNFAKRVAVAVIAIPVLLYIIITGGIYFELLLALIAILAIEEFLNILERKDVSVCRWFSRFIYVGVLAVGIYIPAFFIYTMILGAFLFLLLEIFRNKPDPLYNVGGSILGLIYPITFLLTLVWVRQSESSFLLPEYYVLMVFISIWFMDTSAYLGGVTLGKHKLIPRVSPNKTIEGAVFGFLGSVGIWFIASRIEAINMPLDLALYSGILIGVFGQIGDLFESLLKRDAGIKDSSNLLPGHGGILDRFDSLIFVSPLIWILTLIW